MTGRAPEGTVLAPLPVLFIVVDEFSELLTQQPDFTELFVAIGRLGRSLGMHLLLASQRLDEGRLRGLESHLSYRICLKTFSTSESRSVLGVPDAYHLPSAPGAAYLKTGSGEPLRFQTAFVSEPYESSATRSAELVPPPIPRLFTAAPMGITKLRAEPGTDAHPCLPPNRARHGPRSSRGSRIACSPSVAASADRFAHAGCCAAAGRNSCRVDRADRPRGSPFRAASGLVGRSTGRRGRQCRRRGRPAVG